jgi:YVTN family beta-propeller protein
MRLLRLCRLLAGAGFVACVFASAQTLAQNAYITNGSSAANSVTVIDTETNTVTATIPVGLIPVGVAVTPNGRKVYITNSGFNENTVSVIATATNKVIATIPVGREPGGVAVTPNGRKVYVANALDNTVSVIDAATNMVIGSPIPVGLAPDGVAVTPSRRQNGEENRTDEREDRAKAASKVYVANFDANTVSVIDTATNTVIATIPVGTSPRGVAVTPDGSTVYVSNTFSNKRIGD